MKRELKADHPARCEVVDVEETIDVKDWLQKQAKERSLHYLLAHADDGVIWGRLDGEKLVTSFEAAKNDEEARKVCPELRTKTLQQARLFADHAELLLWRDGDGKWRARLIENASNDTEAEWLEAFDEPQLLWGTGDRSLSHGFTLLEDGTQGLRHAIPCSVKLKDEHHIRLVVRHYVNRQGFMRVVASRLVKLEVEE